MRAHTRAASDSRAASCIELQERERLRIGFDLHDGPAQTVSAALLQVKMLESLEGESLRLGLSELRATLSDALDEIYALIENLGDKCSGEDRLGSRVSACVEQFAARSGIEPTVTYEGDTGPVSPSLRIAVFRIVQEALSNVSRHASATHVDVRLHLSPSAIVCEVADDGDGFAPQTITASRRGREPYGLYSMRERARMLDGECTIDSSPGKGTRVRVEIPVWQG